MVNPEIAKRDQSKIHHDDQGSEMDSTGMPTETDVLQSQSISRPETTKQPTDLVWQHFLPIYDSVKNSIIAATCKACLLTLGSKLHQLKQHLRKNKSCNIATKTKEKDVNCDSEITGTAPCELDAPVLLSPAVPALNSCFICGETPKKKTKASFETFEQYPSNWSRSIAASLCQLLELENDGEGKDYSLQRILASGIYCSTCSQIIRDINWIQRTISSLNSKLANLNEVLVNRIRVGGGKSSQQQRKCRGEQWDKSAFVQNLKCRRHQTQPPMAVSGASVSVQVQIKAELHEEEEEFPTAISEEYVIPDLSIDSDQDFDYENKVNVQDASDSEDCDVSPLPPKRVKRPEAKRKPIGSVTMSTSTKWRSLAIPCPINSCTRRFIRPCKLDIHLRKDHENDPLPYHCAVVECGAKFDFRNKLDNHRKMHTNEEKRELGGRRRVELPCPIPECGKVFNARRLLNTHVQRVHYPRLNFRYCQFCGKSFRKCDDGIEATEELVKIHESLHQSNAIPFSCVLDSCPVSFQNSKDLRKHVGSEHEENRFHCDLCPGSSFNFKKSLREHKRRHHKNTGQVWTCAHPGCKYVTGNKPNLWGHVKCHEEERSHQCDQCGQAYKSKRNLAAHFQIKHSAETPYKCPHCDLAFKSSRLLNNHEVTHTGNPTVHLCEGCGKQFVNASNLRTHVKYRCPKGPQVPDEDIQSYRNKCRDATRSKRAQWRALYGYDRLPPTPNSSKKRKVKPPSSDEEEDGHDGGSPEVDERIMDRQGDFHHAGPCVSGSQGQLSTLQGSNQENQYPIPSNILTLPFVTEH